MVAFESSVLIHLRKRSGREKATIGFQDEHWLRELISQLPGWRLIGILSHPRSCADIEPSATPPFLNLTFQPATSRLETPMLNSKLTSALRRLGGLLNVPALLLASATFGD